MDAPGRKGGTTHRTLFLIYNGSYCIICKSAK